MSFADLSTEEDGVELLERSLARGRLGHGYLFSGGDLEQLELVARTLAKALNCEAPRPNRRAAGAPDSCDTCRPCRKIDQSIHPDVQWIRPESKSRVITIDQMRDLMQTIYLKPTEARYKVAVIVAADRLNVQAANAFLKTLEEPPDRSILILLSTDPGRIIETILSRCLRLNFSGESSRFQDPAFVQWLEQFANTAVIERGTLLSRYRLLSVLLTRLNEMKERVGEELKARSPLERYDDIEPKLRDRWEDELAAGMEAEYRRRRGELLAGLQLWLRDVWLRAMGLGDDLLNFPALDPLTTELATRISAAEAMENIHTIERTQWLLGSNVQEALALEVGLLRLKL